MTGRARKRFGDGHKQAALQLSLNLVRRQSNQALLLGRQRALAGGLNDHALFAPAAHIGDALQQVAVNIGGSVGGRAGKVAAHHVGAQGVFGFAQAVEKLPNWVKMLDNTIAPTITRGTRLSNSINAPICNAGWNGIWSC